MSAVMKTASRIHSGDSRWQSLGFSPVELRPDVTLTNGQCFHWTPHKHRINTWTGVIDKFVISIKQTNSDTLYRIHHPPPLVITEKLQKEINARLLDYFHHSTAPSLSSMYNEWSNNDSRFARVSRAYSGLRLIRQNPLECLISFICSSNNNIGRITSMLQNLRQKYGTHLTDVDIHSEEIDDVNEGETIKIKTESPDITSDINNDNQENNNLNHSTKELKLNSEPIPLQSFYSFPTLEQLSLATESELQEIPLKFGYRAKYIVDTVKILQTNGGETWLQSLRGKTREEIETSLQQLSGVGPKVASCVALFCLDSFSSVPVDVHVLAIAIRDYRLKSASKTMNKSNHTIVAEFFRNLFGPHAGWAHSILFCADLSQFKHKLIQFEAKIKQENKEENEISIKTEEIVQIDEKQVFTARSERATKRQKIVNKEIDQKVLDNVVREIATQLENSTKSINEEITIKVETITDSVKSELQPVSKARNGRKRKK